MSTEVMPGKVLRELSPQESIQLVEAWLEIFGKDRLGTNSKAYLWHIFSANRYPCVSGAEARIQYEQQSAYEYIVVSNRRDSGFVTDQRPSQCYMRDWLVFPENFAWTMAFTHEDGWYGPYFARHEKFTDLNGENQTKIRKVREAETARLKGWR